jgi:hypothetical protein
MTHKPETDNSKLSSTWMAPLPLVERKRGVGNILRSLSNPLPDDGSKCIYSLLSIEKSNLSKNKTFWKVFCGNYFGITTISMMTCRTMTHKPKFETLWHWDGTAGTGRQKMTQKDFLRMFVESLPRWWTKVYFSSALDWANNNLAIRNKK